MPPGDFFVDEEGVPVKMFGASTAERWRGYAYALGVAWTLWSRRKEYEVAYFLMQGLQLATGIPVARLLGKPVVMKFSGSSLVLGMRASLTGRLCLWMLKHWAAKILVLNPGMVEECREVGLDLAKVGFMPNPVDVELFRPVSNAEKLRLRQELGVEAESGLVLYVGRLGPEKRLESLLDGFALVRERMAGARLVLVGDGPERARLEERARLLQLGSSVRLTGRQNGEGVRRWMQASDAIALVSEVEGLPCVLIEGMAAGLPVIASNIPGNTQVVVEEQNGLLTEVGDAKTIAAAVERLLQDRDLRDRLGQASRQVAIARYSSEQVVSMYEALFKEVLRQQ